MKIVVKGGKTIDSCPLCGHDEFEVEMIYSGRGGYFYRFDGKDTDNSEMHEGIDYRELKTAYCAQCKNKIGMVKDT